MSAKARDTPASDTPVSDTLAPDTLAEQWADAALAALLLALDPVGLGGAVLRAPHGPVREGWLALLRAAMPPGAKLHRLPPGIGDARLLGGLDLAATLAAGRPVAERGVLAGADGGVVLVPMAERLPAATAARLAQALDTGAAAPVHGGAAERARIGVVALDESAGEEAPPPAALLDRVAIHLDLGAVPPRLARAAAPGQGLMADARLRLRAVTEDAGVTEALCATALALGVGSLRAPVFALRVARASAALAGRDHVADDDIRLAARLVLAPRATRLPAPADQAADPPPPPPDPPDGDDARPDPPEQARALADMLLEAARAALPEGVLARLRAAAPARGTARTLGRFGEQRTGDLRGRPIGTRQGDPRDGGRLDLLETIRAAAPWQAARRDHAPDATRLRVRKSDFRLIRRVQRRETTTIFGVDASGSAALNRLAEAKGAVELLLAECYVRRDRVAVVAFRGRTAEVLLPPTRALARAKRSLAGLPGGGGTPLAAGIDALAALAQSERRAQRTPSVVLLTDGRANVARDGAGGRAKAEADALAAAKRLAGLACVVVDTSPRPHPFAREIAAAIGGRYLPLPYARAETLSAAVRATLPPARP